jgi:hypothetical protein
MRVFDLGHAGLLRLCRDGARRLLALAPALARHGAGRHADPARPLLAARLRHGQDLARFTLVITVAVVLSAFVSENIRLFGWVLTLMKGGLIDGYVRAWTDSASRAALQRAGDRLRPRLRLFPLHALPAGPGHRHDPRRRAPGGGRSRRHPLAGPARDRPAARRPRDRRRLAPDFVLSAGAIAEAKLLGGQAVIVIGDEIETAFTYGQNWPLGSALAMVLIADHRRPGGPRPQPHRSRRDHGAQALMPLARSPRPSSPMAW